MRSIEPQKSGKFKVRFRLRGTQTSELFPTRREAEHFAQLLDLVGAQAAVDQIYDDEQKADVPTFEDYAEQAITDLTRPSAETKRKYRQIVRDHWLPELAGLQMHQITRRQIATVVNGWAADGDSDKSMRNWWGVVAPMFRHAVNEGLIERNPCLDVKLPRVTEHESDDMCILDADDMRRLVDAMTPHYRALILTLVDTGMRWGEAAAATVGDVDRKAWTLRITKAMKRDGSIGPPKTKRSRRTIYLNQTVRDALEPLLIDRPKTDKLFTGQRGGNLRHRTFWSDHWRPAVWRAQHCAEHTDPNCRCGTAHPERCSVHRGETVAAACGCDGTLTVSPRIHDLRHTHASTLLAAGMPIHVVQDRLGHESIKTTSDTYGHLLPDHQKMAARVGAFGLTAGPETPALN